MSFQKATQSNLFAKILIYGMSGSGKTPSSLRLARGIKEAMSKPHTKIGMIDTERGKGALYSTQIGEKENAETLHFDFLHSRLDDHNVDNFISEIQLAKEEGIEILIIDSISHQWMQSLIRREKIAQEKFGGNTWAATSVTKPEYNQFLNAILNYPGHVICTARCKHDWEVIEGKPTKVGLNPIQSDQIEYEFDVVIQLLENHNGLFSRWRNYKLNQKTFDLITEEHGEKIYNWLNQPTWKEEFKEAKTKDDIVKINNRYPLLKEDEDYRKAGKEALKRVSNADKNNKDD